jgi:CHAD domain-containing protein
MRASADPEMFARALAKKSLNRLIYQCDRTRDSTGIEEVHDLRVAIRRFRQTVATFRTSFPSKEMKRIQRVLKKTMKLAGEVRDLDIVIELLGKLRFGESADLSVRFRTRRKEPGRALAAKLRRLNKRRLFSKWRREVSLNRDAGGRASLEDAANKTISPLLRRFFLMGNRAANLKGGNLEQLHQFRIIAKKIRYTLELFVPLRPALVRQRLAELKELQGCLGSVNDLEIAQALVSHEKASYKLCAALIRKRDEQVEKFASYWRTEFASAAKAALWKQDLTAFRVPGKPPARSPALRRIEVRSSASIS